MSFEITLRSDKIQRSTSTLDFSIVLAQPLDRYLTNSKYIKNWRVNFYVLIKFKQFPWLFSYETIFYEYIRNISPLHVRRTVCVTGGSSRNEIKLIFGSGQHGITSVRHSSSLSVLMELRPRNTNDRRLVDFFSKERDSLKGRRN